MTRRLTLLVLCLAAAIVPAKSNSARDPSNLVVHEWGTFTSVAGPTGEPVEWPTLGGVQDLPCFVNRFELGKNSARATIRMETPVLYFYAPHATTVDVEVHLKQGFITEWFPRATVTPGVLTPAFSSPAFKHKLAWRDVRVSPDVAEQYPKEAEPSHYYPARETDARPIQVGGQTEKFLFYRGVARFPVPIHAAEEDNAVVVRNVGREPISSAILFENRDGRIGYRVHDDLRGTVRWDRPSLTGDIRALTARLEKMLVAHGLFAREARAMIETWRDSWFEHGTRIFYFSPAAMVDDVLPLRIEPQPAQIARVFVGRVEVITNEAKQEVSAAVAQSNPGAAAKYGRLLPSIIERVYPFAASSDQTRLHVQRVMERVYAGWNTGPRSCATRPGGK